MGNDHRRKNLCKKEKLYGTELRKQMTRCVILLMSIKLWMAWRRLIKNNDSVSHNRTVGKNKLAHRFKKKINEVLFHLEHN